MTDAGTMLPAIGATVTKPLHETSVCWPLSITVFTLPERVQNWHPKRMLFLPADSIRHPV